MLATTFTGNVPHFDVLATDPEGRTLAIQVKTSNGGRWQFDIRQFVEAEMDKDKKHQVLGCEKKEPYPDLICVFVVAASLYGADSFFILDWRDLQRVIVPKYRHYLEKKDYLRPRRHNSFHFVLKTKDLDQYKDKWVLIKQRSSGGC